MKKLNKYPNGGQNVVDFLGNYGKAIADTGLSTIGMGDVINQDSYKGNSAKAFNTVSNITGGLAKTALPMVAGMVAGPMGGMAAQGIQGVGSQVNNQIMQDQQQNMMKMGGLNIYANGGMPNSEVESEENSITPNGDFTQYDGPTHENGGVPTNLEQGEMVFSDRLKLGKKTFAHLNKANNTNKEDKMLENEKSNRLQKLTAQLMKEAKMKQSMKLFETQEALKQAKVESYAKRMGVDSNKFSFGGINKFPGGGTKGGRIDRSLYAAQLTANPVGNNYTSIGNDFKDPYREAGINSNLTNTGFIKGAVDSKGYPTYTNAGGEQFMRNEANTHYVNFGKGDFSDPSSFAFGKKTAMPVNTMTANIGQRGPIEVAPMTNNVRQPLNFNNPGGVYNPNNGTTYTTDPNASGAQVIQPQIVKQAYGGVYNKYPYGGRNAEQDAMIQDSTNYNNKQQNIANDNGNFGMYSKDDQNALNGVNPTQGQGTNWGNIAKQGALALGNNIGNIYDLARGNKTEVQKYDRAGASLTNPNDELRYNDQVFAGAKEDIRNASVGNSSTYIQNRKDLAINQMSTNARIKSQYDNQNAGIQNQNNQFNANISKQEQDANAMNRASSRNLQGQALSNIGQNIMGQYRDSNMQNRDQDMLGIIQGQYPQGMNNPALAAYYQKNGRR